jgi:hypothetical protein
MSTRIEVEKDDTPQCELQVADFASSVGAIGTCGDISPKIELPASDQ